MSPTNKRLPPGRRPAPQPAGDIPDDESFSALFAASEHAPKRQRIAVGDLVTGKVIAIGETTVFVAIGDRNEATIDAAELRDPASGELGVAVGDEIQATVIDDGGRSGSAVLRRGIGRSGNAAAELEQALEHGLPIEGLVTAEVKGGFEVQVGPVRAFCPGSQNTVK